MGRGRIAGEEAPMTQAPTVGSLGRKAGGAVLEGQGCSESYEGKPATSQMKHRKAGGGVGYEPGVSRSNGGISEGVMAAKRYDRPTRKRGGAAK